MTDPYADFASFYDLWSGRMTEDVGFYVKRALEASGPVVELGAGSGRISVPIAEAGRDVVAVDASPAMIARGRDHATAARVGERIVWVEEDMRAFVARPPVDLVIVPFRSFLHLTETRDQLATLRAIASSLVAGGRLILNFFQPDPGLQIQHDGRRVREGEFTDEDGRRCTLWRVGTYEPATQVLSARAICERYRGDRLDAVEEAAFELRFVYRYEFEHLLARTGFEVEALYGWFDERPFAQDSKEMIWVARKP